MIELKSTVKELIVKDDDGTYQASITASHDDEFKIWNASIHLATFGYKTDEEAVLALEAPAEAFLRTLRGSSSLSPKSKRLITREAKTSDDAEHMRRVRNSCRETMTRNQQMISVVDQQLWFTNLDRDLLVPLITSLNDEPIGYGISRLDNSFDVPGTKKWITAGLLPEFRGQGLGEELFRDVILRAGIPCWLEVLKSNVNAKRLYDKLGFEVINEVADNNRSRLIMVLRDFPQ